MKYFCIVLLTLLFTVPSMAQDSDDNSRTSTFYFIRHAEKDRSDKTNKNPNLTEKGKQRAEKWSQVLKHVKFDAVYSTDYNRTMQTAQPTANANKLVLSMYDPRNIDAKAFLRDNKGKTVLVVGHSNTTPTFVNLILGSEKYPQINDNNNANLYVITVSPSGEMVDVLLYVE